MKECVSLSGRSTLTYKMKGKKICLVANTGSGVFNKDWIKVDEVLSSLGNLKEFFKDKSSNTTGFVLAVLLNERLIERAKDRQYVKVKK